jgi:hypothetical protein
MEPEVSLPFSKELASSPYPEPYESYLLYELLVFTVRNR